MDVFVARQPIFDPEYNVVAYELLYRDGLKNFYYGSRADNVATSILLSNAFLTFGIENLVAGKRAFINFDQYSITQRIPELLNPDNITIEILETVQPDKTFINEIKKLKEKGYCVALDDYCQAYDFEEVIDLVDLVKIDFFQNSHDEIEAQVKRFKGLGKVVLAEKVETKEEFEWAKGIGFDLFQGYFFAKPAIQTKRKLNNSAIQYMKLMSELNKDEPDFKKTSDIVKLDVALTYKLLKLVNDIVKPSKKIGSIQQGIALLGLVKFRRWLMLSVVQNMASKETYELSKVALFRTAFLSSIAQHSNLHEEEEALALLGSLSVLNTILEIPMEEVVEQLPLEDSLSKTLLNQESEYSLAYMICLNYEKGDFDHIEDDIEKIGYNISDLKTDYVAAIKWAEETYNQLNLFN